MAEDGQAIIPVCILFGPTASGKTAILEALWAATGASGEVEVVSADSMQVYRGMDIGTAKPSAALQAALPHHLIDIRYPNERFTVGAFVHLADACCLDIVRRGKLPIVSGGTGFYLKHFILGLPEAPPSDENIRRELREELRRRGKAALWEALAAGDRESAARIHPNDEYRLLRALEVLRSSGRPLSDFAVTQADLGRPRYQFLILGLERDREDLYRRIDERCAQMFRSGLPEEVRRLVEAGYSPKDPGLRAIGYREFFVEPEPGVFRLSQDLRGVETLVARNSRRYAKRQCSYGASIPGLTWVSASADSLPRIQEHLALLCLHGG
ncbi:MAG: tRNA (adenosine(37)-N6)-dimethylallyltransferase MiaA [Spirochaetaceae bacterium]|jgi:tRNA dimethylallyltransferase|nr:tRNA (adenosine(37)-N6)-dimethylallyltransferase MiaA [Spirochaetaceae bacterium]